MLDLALVGFVALMLVLGLRRPFIWVLAYIYIDIVSPQKIGWVFVQALPLSLIAFGAAFAGWLFFDSKQGSRFSLRQGLIAALLVLCAVTTLNAQFPEAAWTKWDWVWKALVFAIFLPLTLRTALRLEAATLVIVVSVSAIVINGGIKTLLGGGGYGTLTTLVRENSGIYEGSTLSMVAIATIPLILWLARHGTIFPRSRMTMALAAATVFAAMLIPLGTQTRTGLLCVGLLTVLWLRGVKYRFAYLGAAALALALAVPFLPASYTARMSTISNPQGDQSASTRMAVWRWTIEYVKERPLGGGFDSYLGNSFAYQTRHEVIVGNSTEVVTGEVVDKGRAFHSAYFEMLGEQGWLGLFLWLWLHALGLWQMERLRRSLRRAEDAQGQAWRALASALQNGQAVYLFGALFVGIAYQPFIFMLVGLQIALVTQVARRDKAAREVTRREQLARRRSPSAATQVPFGQPA